MKESNKKLWGTILKLVITLATAVAGAFGLGACMG